MWSTRRNFQPPILVPLARVYWRIDGGADPLQGELRLVVGPILQSPPAAIWSQAVMFDVSDQGHPHVTCSFSTELSCLSSRRPQASVRRFLNREQRPGTDGIVKWVHMRAASDSNSDDHHGRCCLFPPVRPRPSPQTYKQSNISGCIVTARSIYVDRP